MAAMSQTRSFQTSKWISALYVLSAILLPVSIQLIWLYHHTQVPQSDATEPILSSFLVYNHLAHHEWGAFFRTFFTMRAGRPIAFYMTEVPFQIISHGNLLFTAKAVTVLFTSLNCLYTYLLLRLLLDRKEAMLGTMVLGLMPVFQWAAAFFALTEIAFMPATLAAIYYLIRSENLTNVRYSIYFVLAAFVAFCMRPVEAFLHFLPVFMFLLGLMWHRRQLAFPHIYTVLTAAMVGTSLLIFSWFKHDGPLSSPDDKAFKVYIHRAYVISYITTFMFGYLLGALISSASWRQALKKHSPNVLLCFIALSGLVTFYYYSFVVHLVNWVYSCSIGELAAEYQKASMFVIWEMILLSAALLPFCIVSIMGIFSLVFCLSKEQKTMLLHHPILYLAGLIPLPFIMVFISIQAGQRKVTTMLGAFLIMMAIPALMRGRWWHTRITLLVMVLAWQIGGLAWLYNDHPSTTLLRYTVAGGTMPALITLDPNPHDEVANFIISAARKHGYKKVMMPIIGNARVLDPFLISAMVKMYSGGQVEGVFVPYLIPNYNSGMIAKLLQDSGGDAFIILPDQPIAHSEKEVPRLKELRDKAWYAMDKIAYDLLILYAENKVDTVGGKKVECDMVGSIFSAERNVEVCMYEIEKKKP